MAEAAAAAQNDERGEVLLDIRGLKMHFPIHKGVIFRRETARVKAVDGISFDIRRGETLGLVGESGCGKSTTGRAILRLYQPTAGEVIFKGQDLTKLSHGKMRAVRSKLQMIFQDPYASLNPRMTVGNIIAEPIVTHRLVSGKAAIMKRVQELMATVGLDPRFVRRYPHEFSGGQRQRIGIARALASKPEFLVCDEPISALDVSIQAQIMNLMGDLQRQFGLTYLFIAHDLAAVRHISDRIAVMYLGNLVEIAEAADLYHRPRHPYTRALISAVPIPDPEVEASRQRVVLEGDVPSPIDPPSGCPFHTRCPFAWERCGKERPELVDVGGGHRVACHLNDEPHREGAVHHQSDVKDDPADGSDQPVKVAEEPPQAGVEPAEADLEPAGTDVESAGANDAPAEVEDESGEHESGVDTADCREDESAQEAALEEKT